ncbi:MAG: hypothetical protein LBL52_03680 [Rickettsiales bacterium]|jgi:predicted phage terminase large subunit-like protein|nr:hypothetical protein [Rickettsiales bacterium]
MSEESFLADYDLLKIPIIENGEAAWPERYSPQKIEELRVRVGDAKFSSQMMLSPVDSSGVQFDVARLSFYSDDLVFNEGNGAISFSIGRAKIVRCSCWWDPSYAEIGGDASVVCVVFSGEDGLRYLYDVEYLRGGGEGSGYVQCEQVARFLRRNFVPQIFIEANGIGKFLPEMLRERLTLDGMACKVVEQTSSKSKAIRIADAFDAALAGGRLLVHSRVRSTPWAQEFSEWSAVSSAHDDGMDAVAGALLASGVRMPARSAELDNAFRGRFGHGKKKLKIKRFRAII